MPIFGTIPSTANVVAGAITGTLGKSSFPSGSIIQAVRNTGGMVTTTSASFADVLSVSITPFSTSSKFIVICSAYASIRRNQDPMYGGFRVLRNSTNITYFDRTGLGYSGFESANVTKWAYWSDIILDTPSTTSAITYKIQTAHFDKPFGGYSPDQFVTDTHTILVLELAS